jgi:Flp pilus assembly protein TadG
MKPTSKPQTEAMEANKKWLMRAIWRSEKGQSLVELALLTPILLLLVVGIVEMGRYATLSIEVANAARAGAA